MKVSLDRLHPRFSLIPALLLAILVRSSESRSGNADTEARSRRPVAVALLVDGERLVTANRDCGTVSVIDVESLIVIDEISIGGRPSDIVALPSDRLLVLDEQNHKLVLVKHDGNQWRVASRTDVAPYPVRLILDGKSAHCFVSSLWSQTVSLFRLPMDDDASAPRLVHTTRLPFEPRELCLTNEADRLIVACAFEARLAVIGAQDLAVDSIRSIPGHNIRGMAISQKTNQLLVSQQELNSLAHSTRDDVHWGNMIADLLASFPVDHICDPSTELMQHRMVTQLGEPGAAAADPGCIVHGDREDIAILLSGVHEVVVGANKFFDNTRRVSVGKRPVAAVASEDGRIFVANMYSDLISVVDLEEGKEINRISLGTQAELDLVRRGEALFFDARLSHDGWMSCHSCHTDGHSNGQLNDNLSDGSFGAPKRVLSLLSVADTEPGAWSGDVTSLEQQVPNSIANTMQGEPPGDQQVEALVAFMKTLSTPRVLHANLANDKASIARGKELFASLGCAQCHAPPTYTSAKAYDIGFTDVVGNQRFNPPSLRGVASRRSFFHDGRASSLTEVFTKHKHQVGEDLKEDDVKSLVSYLKTLGEISHN